MFCLARGQFGIILVVTMGFMVFSTALNLADDFEAIFEKSVITFPDHKMATGNYSYRKYNRTTLTLDLNYVQHDTFNRGDVKLRARTYQYLSNEYRPTAVDLTLDYCNMLDTNQYGIHNFLRPGNFSLKCPMPAGYFCKTSAPMRIDLTPFKLVNVGPSFVGRWMLSSQLQYKGKPYYGEDLYILLKRIK